MVSMYVLVARLVPHVIATLPDGWIDQVTVIGLVLSGCSSGVRKYVYVSASGRLNLRRLGWKPHSRLCYIGTTTLRACVGVLRSARIKVTPVDLVACPSRVNITL